MVSIIKSKLPVDRDDINAMVKKAIDLIGGIEKFVKKGDVVVIKPNLFAPFPPPISVDRRVVGALVALCKVAGAKKTVVIEGVSVGTLMKRANLDASDRENRLVRGMKTVDMMKLLGLKKSVEAAGVRRHSKVSGTSLGKDT